MNALFYEFLSPSPHPPFSLLMGFVNGEMHMLTPGMVGVVRPEDSVRHVVPKASDVKLLVIWARAGEAKILQSREEDYPFRAE